MNQSNQSPQHQFSSLQSFEQNPLQFTPFTSQPNPNPNLNLNQFISLPVPRKRRRGRAQRNPTSSAQSQTHAFSFPAFFNNQIVHSTSNSASVVNPSIGNPILSVPNKVPDVSDEIIVINKEATAEALLALTAGFPADSLTDEEIDAGVVRVVGGIEQVNYILIRNHIITKWRENVSNWVTKEMFINVVPPHCKTLLDSAYNYLVSRGYINFGVAPAIREKILGELSKGHVIIIGAGLAGLGAARQLMSFGFKATVLEGRKRAGGRVYTKRMEGSNRLAAADLGGSVLTGTLGNPLGIMARQLSSPLHKIRDKCPLYGVDGKPVDPDMDSKVETAFNRLLDKASRLRQLMGEVSVDVSLGAALETFRYAYGDAVTAEEMNLFNWHLANLEYANAGLTSNLSLAFWDQDDPYDMGGDHCFLPGGNGRLVQALSENVSILYEKTVHTIRYGSDGVQVVAGSQVFEGDMALCTVPLGVLKSGSIKFIPELPQRKLDGIKRLGFGLLNKVAMLFPHVFWGTDLDTFGHLVDDPCCRGEFFLFYSYATVAGGPLLLALVAGEAAHKFETMPPTDAVSQVIQILKGIYEPQGIVVPEPIQTVCTRWGSDPFCLGSYSNVAVGASGDDYDILAENVGDGRLFFAGEATNRRYPATMHGAFLSGLREAANMAHYAQARSSGIKVERSPSNDAHSCATMLADLFRKNVDLKSTAILRVAFNGSRKKSIDGDQQHSKKVLFQQLQSHFNLQQELHVYTLLSRQQAHELREVRGGDEMRLNYLSEKLGVKLVGRKGLGPAANSVIASIKAERGKRKPASTSVAVKPGLCFWRIPISSVLVELELTIVWLSTGTSRMKMDSLKKKPIKIAKVVANGIAPPPKTLDTRDGLISKAVGSTSQLPKIVDKNDGSAPKLAGDNDKTVAQVNENNFLTPKVIANGNASAPKMLGSVDDTMSQPAGSKSTMHEIVDNYDSVPRIAENNDVTPNADFATPGILNTDIFVPEVVGQNSGSGSVPIVAGNSSCFEPKAASNYDSSMSNALCKDGGSGSVPMLAGNRNCFELKVAASYDSSVLNVGDNNGGPVSMPIVAENSNPFEPKVSASNDGSMSNVVDNNENLLTNVGGHSDAVMPTHLGNIYDMANFADGVEGLLPSSFGNSNDLAPNEVGNNLVPYLVDNLIPLPMGEMFGSNLSDEMQDDEFTTLWTALVFSCVHTKFQVPFFPEEHMVNAHGLKALLSNLFAAKPFHAWWNLIS
ncbi:SWIRM domain [Dillenia turbinata]|uniref:SWIRM domain n=1 Tax=Dillenia turbinata TaxID=194707 RepID=A0AAN8ZBK8_9MAGN